MKEELVVTPMSDLQEMIGETVRKEVKGLMENKAREKIDLITIKQVCSEFGMTRPTLLKHTKSGMFEAYNPDERNSSLVRYRRSEVARAWKKMIYE